MSFRNDLSLIFKEEQSLHLSKTICVFVLWHIAAIITSLFIVSILVFELRLHATILIVYGKSVAICSGKRNHFRGSLYRCLDLIEQNLLSVFAVQPLLPCSDNRIESTML